MKPIVDIISLGGTIAMKPDGETAGVVPTLMADDLVEAIPQLNAVATIRTQSFRNIPGAHLTFDDIDAVAIEIRKCASSGSSGIVITQGTDTIEETAYALDLILDLEIPVIVTGAMRNPTRPGADGPANLLGAVQVASHSDARFIGTIVVFNDEIHAARFVRKTHTSSPSTFQSDPFGPIGWLAEDQVRILLRPKRLSVIGSASQNEHIRVAIIKLGLGDDGTLIDAAIDAGFNGLVIEALGGGHVPISVAKSLEWAAKKIPVILASRTGTGEALTRTYGFKGSEIDLLEKGLVSAGRFDGCRARVLLTILLRSHNSGIEQLHNEFRVRSTQ